MSADLIEAFISRWENSGAAERANYQMFLAELADLLGVPRPDPTSPDPGKNLYVVDRAITRTNPDGTPVTNYIDLYKARFFVLETKQGVTADGSADVLELKSAATKTGHGKRGTAAFDKALERALNQGRGYITSLPASHGRPPFLMVYDVGYSIDVYAEFTCTGGHYERFPDPRNHRIPLSDLRKEETLGITAAAKDIASAAQKLRSEAKKKDAEALKLVTDFHCHLCKIKFLDPACGTANFLYVTLAHMKRLEADVLELVTALGGDATFEMNEYKVLPEQFLGLELSHNAVAIAQLVLWIGYFQWQRKTTGKADTGDRPLLPKTQTIRQQDAVLAYDEKIPRRDPVSREILTLWNGYTTKTHPVTGKEVPDESATVALFDYKNPRRAEWPQADYIVGNPPFIGTKRMIDAFGGGDTEALRKAWKGAGPESADFVMYWWQKAAAEVLQGRCKQFGFITTNSIHQTFNRRVIESFLEGKDRPPGGLANEESGRDARAPLLTRLVALNHERAAEEKRGLIRWLRPDYQNPTKDRDGHRPPLQGNLAGTEASSQSTIQNQQSSIDNPSSSTDWPEKLPEQVAILRKLITGYDKSAVTPDAEVLSALFGRKNKKRTDQITAILATLKALGHL